MRIVLCFAWPAEAKPWLKRVNCKLRFQVKHMRYYQGADYDILIAGMGPYHLPAAIGWIQGLIPEDKIWWNIGIAGGKENQLHQWFYISSVTNERGADFFYPEISILPNMPLGMLQTSAQPVSKTVLAAADTLADMEGFAFCMAAQLFASTSRIQLLKWVSDNGVENFDKHSWQKKYADSMDEPLQLIQAHHKKIASMVVTTKPDIDVYLQPLLDALRPTFSQQVMIKDALYFARQYHGNDYIQKRISAIPQDLKQKKEKNVWLLQLLNELRNV